MNQIQTLNPLVREPSHKPQEGKARRVAKGKGRKEGGKPPDPGPGQAVDQKDKGGRKGEP